MIVLLQVFRFLNDIFVIIVVFVEGGSVALFCFVCLFLFSGGFCVSGIMGVLKKNCVPCFHFIYLYFAL